MLIRYHLDIKLIFSAHCSALEQFEQEWPREAHMFEYVAPNW